MRWPAISVAAIEPPKVSLPARRSDLCVHSWSIAGSVSRRPASAASGPGAERLVRAHLHDLFERRGIAECLVQGEGRDAQGGNQHTVGQYQLDEVLGAG